MEAEYRNGATNCNTPSLSNLLRTVERRQQSVPRYGTPYENETKCFSIDFVHIVYRITHFILDNFLKNTQRWTENMRVCVWERERERQETIHDCNFVSRLYICRQNYCTYEERINNILEKTVLCLYSNEDCHNLHLSPDSITMTKSVRKRLTGHVICRKRNEWMQNFGRKLE